MKVKLTPALLLVALVASGCEDGPPTSALPAGGVVRDAGALPAPAPKPAETAANGPPPTYRDTDFVESDRNRDPFRSFVSELRAKVPVVAQRAVIMPNTEIDEMRLIAVITGISQPRAMLVDQKGVGYVTTRGDFVGKADVVQGGGTESLPISLNWRVDRIRENEIVLAREDPSAPNRPPLTKVIPLHAEGEEGGDQS